MWLNPEERSALAHGLRVLGPWSLGCFWASGELCLSLGRGQMCQKLYTLWWTGSKRRGREEPEISKTQSSRWPTSSRKAPHSNVFRTSNSSDSWGLNTDIHGWHFTSNHFKASWPHITSAAFSLCEQVTASLGLNEGGDLTSHDAEWPLPYGPWWNGGHRVFTNSLFELGASP